MRRAPFRGPGADDRRAALTLAFGASCALSARAGAQTAAGTGPEPAPSVAAYVAARAHAINARGDVAGEVVTPAGTTLPAIWRAPAAATGTAGATTATACYRLDVLPVPSGATDARARALDTTGTAVGEAWTRAAHDSGGVRTGLPRAIRWVGGSPTLLPGLDRVARSWAVAVNASGQIAGSTVDARGHQTGFLFTPGRPLARITTAGARDLAVRALNDRGVVAGVLGPDLPPELAPAVASGVDRTDAGLGRAVFVWRAGRLTPLFEAGSAYVSVGGLNARGDLVGGTVYHANPEDDPAAPRAAPYWFPGDGRGLPRPRARSVLDAPDPAGSAYAYVAVNARGARLGLTRTGVDPRTGSAYVADSGTSRLLPVPPALGRVLPANLNDAGVVAGTVVGGTPDRAVVWDAGGRLRVLPLAPGACDVRADSGAIERRPASGR